MTIFGKKMIKGITVACGVSLVAAALSGCNLLGSNKPSNNVQNLNQPSENVTVTEPETKPENIEPEDGWTKPESTDTQTVDAASLRKSPIRTDRRKKRLSPVMMWKETNFGFMKPKKIT